jgi:hypothetical protein
MQFKMYTSQAVAATLQENEIATRLFEVSKRFQQRFER